MTALTILTVEARNSFRPEDFEAGSFVRIIRTGEVLEILQAEPLGDGRVELVVVRDEP